MWKIRKSVVIEQKSFSCHNYNIRYRLCFHSRHAGPKGNSASQRAKYQNLHRLQTGCLNWSPGLNSSLLHINGQILAVQQNICLNRQTGLKRLFFVHRIQFKGTGLIYRSIATTVDWTSLAMSCYHKCLTKLGLDLLGALCSSCEKETLPKWSSTPNGLM